MLLLAKSITYNRRIVRLSYVKHITHRSKGNKGLAVPWAHDPSRPPAPGREALIKWKELTPQTLRTWDIPRPYPPSLRFPPAKITASQIDVLISWACLGQSMPGGRHPINRGFILPFQQNVHFMGELHTFSLKKGSVPTGRKNKLFMLKKTAHSWDHVSFSV